MANTVNGLSAIATDSNRVKTGVIYSNFRNQPAGGTAYRATLILDTPASDFTVDGFSVAFPPATQNSNNRIYIVNVDASLKDPFEFQIKSGSTIVYSQSLQAGCPVTYNEQYIPLDVAANLVARVEQVGSTVINGSNPVRAYITYVVADSASAEF